MHMEESSKMRKDYWAIAWPASLEGLLIVTLSAVDMFMVSSLGEAAIAAVGIFGQPKMAVLLFTRALSVALTVAIAKRYGAGNIESLSRYTKQATTLTIIIATILFFATSLLMKPLLFLAGAEASYIDEAVHYGLITNSSLLFLGLSTVISGALFGIGKMKEVLYANVVGNVIKVFFNYIFIYCMNLGISGAGISSIIGSIITLVIVIWYACRANSPVTMRGKAHWKPTQDVMTEIMSIFKGTFTEQGFERIGMFLNSFFVAKLGVISFATHSICMALTDIIWNMGQGFNKASMTLSAQLCGQKQTGQIGNLVRQSTQLSLIAALAGGLTFFLFRANIISLYSNNTEVIELGTNILIFMAIACIPMVLGLSFSGILRGTGYTSFVAKYSFWIIAVIRPAMTYTFLFLIRLDVYGAWLALLLDQTMRMSIAYWKIRSTRGRIA